MVITNNPYRIVLTFACLSALAFSQVHAQENDRGSWVLKNERELKVTVDAGFGKLYISRGKTTNILDAWVDSPSRREEIADYISYSVRDRIGYMNVDINEKLTTPPAPGDKRTGSKFHPFNSNEWTMQFTDAVPISFDVRFGLAGGELDFTGMRVKDLNVSAGAGAVELSFGSMNREVIENLTIESGVGKVRARELGNANFNRLHVDGGVGSYTLDFSGALSREADVDVEVGLGTVTILLPKNVGARIAYEKSLIARLSLDRGFNEESENVYVSPNYESARGRLNIRVQAGMGNVRVRMQ
jgi:hypothetical protein